MEVMTATIVQKEKKGLFCKSIFQHGVTAHAGDEIFYLKPRQGGRRSDLLVYVMLKKKKKYPGGSFQSERRPGSFDWRSYY